MTPDPDLVRLVRLVHGVTVEGALQADVRRARAARRTLLSIRNHESEADDGR